MKPITAIFVVAIILGAIVGGALIAAGLQTSSGGSITRPLTTISFTTSTAPSFSPPTAYSSSTFVSSSYSSQTTSSTLTSSSTAKSTTATSSSIASSSITLSSTSDQNNVSIVLTASVKNNGPPPYPPLQVGLTAKGPNHSLAGLLAISTGGPMNTNTCLDANLSGSINSPNSLSLSGTLYAPTTTIPQPGCPPNILSLAGESVTLTANYTSLDVEMVVTNTPSSINFTGSADIFVIS